MPRKSDYVQAKESFVTHLDGEQIAVRAGELVNRRHRLIKGREDLFEEWKGVRFDVEQATAAPGEKRGKAA